MQKLTLTLMAAFLPALAVAEEPIQQIEEVVVTGAVRSNDAVKVADIDLPSDASLAEMVVAYE